jgi:hypothetical protein
MAARRKSNVTPKFKTKYKVKNWATYEAALRNRGNITFWFDEEAIEAWNSPTSGRPGGQRRYSDLAIVTALTLRTVFHRPLRQTEGFLRSLICRMGLDLKTPDHTTLSRRSATVAVPGFVRRGDQPIHLTIDSTRLKIMGGGEWHVHKHKTSNKRRAWRKLHLAVDGQGFVVASELTDSSTGDASVGVAMIEDIDAEIARFTADGAYDTRAIYETLQEAESRVPEEEKKGTNVTVRATARGDPSSENGVAFESVGGDPPAARYGDRADCRGGASPMAKGGFGASTSAGRKWDVPVQAEYREFALRPDGSDAKGGGKDWGIRCQSNDGVWNAEFGGDFEVNRTGLRSIRMPGRALQQRPASLIMPGATIWPNPVVARLGETDVTGRPGIGWLGVARGRLSH